MPGVLFLCLATEEDILKVVLYEDIKMFIELPVYLLLMGI